jgi:hypothetical protein
MRIGFFKKAGLIVLALVLSAAWLHADLTLLDSEKGKFSVYGFIKLDGVYQDGGVNLLGASRYALPGSGNLFLTAQNSRFGFKLSPAALANGLKISGQLEWDLFDPTTPNQMKFRTRQAFLTLQKGQSSFIFGQTWDLFSPLGPNTLNVNGYLWQVGNVGFRHAQIRYTLSSKTVDFALSVNDPASANGWKSEMPVLQTRLGFKLADKGRFQFGVSGAYGQETNENTTAVPVYKNNVDIIGISLDMNLALAAGLALKGEYAFGENLSYFVSRGGVYHRVAEKQYEGKKSDSLWAQLTYAKDALSMWGGYSFENLKDEAQLAAGEVQETACLMVGGQLALGGGVSLGVEFSHFRTVPYMRDAFNTNQFCFSGMYTF